jgi:pimeloyl-ACP methyl ester carboxylesterase
METLLKAVDPTNKGVIWMGSSMGGNIGIVLASKQSGAIKKIIINDIGPQVSLESLKRISSYLGLKESFATKEECEAKLRQNYSKIMGPTFGDAQYAHYVEHGFNLDKQTGRYVFAYDPGMCLGPSIHPSFFPFSLVPVLVCCY